MHRLPNEPEQPKRYAVECRCGPLQRFDTMAQAMQAGSDLSPEAEPVLAIDTWPDKNGDKPTYARIPGNVKQWRRQDPQGGNNEPAR